MMEENDSVVILTDETGQEVPFEFLDLISYRGKEYVVLLPTDESADEVVVLQLETIDGDTESYIGVDNEYTLAAVFEIFKEKHKSDFNFVD